MNNPTIKTPEIELAVMREYDFLQNTIIPNVHWILGFEADIFMLTKAGYATCFEIKVSKSDLIADRKKRHIRLLKDLPQGAMRYYNKLKHFVYVVPEHLQEIALQEIPDFAGLVVAYKVPESYLPKKVFLKKVRTPKKLSSPKWTEKERVELLRLGTLRIYNMKQKIFGLQTPDQ